MRKLVYGCSILKTEHQEQVEFVSWFRKNRPDIRILAVPNGGLRNRIVAAKLKAEGVSAGVPDLFIPGYRLWVEMKREKGCAVSSNQKDWINYLSTCGYFCIVAKGCSDAMHKVIDFEQSSDFPFCR